MAAFDTAINRLLTNEGGYTPGLVGDPGGETNWGISKREYPDVDIKNLTRDQAVAIYLRDFWMHVHADVLPLILAFQALDFAVNSGIGNAVRALQRAAGVQDDGVWGPATQAAVAAKNPAALTFLFLAERGDFMASLHNWPNFSAGYMHRLTRDMRYAAADI